MGSEDKPTPHLDITPAEATPLQPKDTFRFACTQCGECCFDQLVLLDPFDLFYLSRVGALPEATTSTALFTQGYVTLSLLDEEWRCALVMPRFQRGTKCRFLAPTLNEQGKVLRWSCELHPRGAKPLVCSAAPIAQDMAGGFYLVAPVDTCPGMKQGEPEALQGYLERLRLTKRLEDALWFQRVLRAGTLATRERAMRFYDFDQAAPLRDLEALGSYLRELEGAA